ncbi:MAG: metabolite:H+ symporter (MHS) family protein [Candidatus Tokpelaia sp. JSC188]|nr:MAG: metabolite:H+ symporter (MHS) family protein [Candidatus Tokpelaia sp. JSC188]
MNNTKFKEINSPTNVLFASLIGTTIEFFDFYIYATAAVLVFPHLFFKSSDQTAMLLQSLATFAIAFFARPIGAAIFGYYGDRIGRKTTLLSSLMIMGLSTVAIGLLPTYETIGKLASILLAFCRFGQGFGLGGEWGGAVLLAIENAPPDKIAWYGCFPQLGAPLGFLLSSSTFLLLSEFMNNDQFFHYGWRIPFIGSSVLILVGIYVRLKITETPAFQKVIDEGEIVKMPLITVFSEHKRMIILSTMITLTTFLLFYLMTVFTLSWGTSALGYSRKTFLILQLFSMAFFAITILVSALLANRCGLRFTMILVSIATILFGLFMMPLFTKDNLIGVISFLSLGLTLMGMSYGPLGTMLSELFPARIRYTSISLTFNLGSIFGASLAPYTATWLATHYGSGYVGYYLAASAFLTMIALIMVGKTHHA